MLPSLLKERDHSLTMILSGVGVYCDSRDEITTDILTLSNGWRFSQNNKDGFRARSMGVSVLLA